MILDSLTHITPNGQWFQSRHRAGAEVLLAAMEAAGVEQSILVGMPEPLSTNAETLEIARQHPDRFIPVAALDLAGECDLEVQIKGVKQAGFQGLKIHPRLCGVSIEDERIERTLEIAGRLGIPVFLCTVCKPPHPALNRPLSSILQALCQNHPDTRIVLLHGGYTHLLEVSELIRPLENVLLDLSATLPRFYDSSIGADIRFLIRTFDRRLCVGSDFPEYHFADVLNAFQALGFSREELEYKGILGDNLLRFIREPSHATRG